MNVLIITSSKEEIELHYKSLAKNVSNFLALHECDLVFGASQSSMMGICYKEFVEKNRTIYSFTTDKYIEELKKLDKSKQFIRKNTFDLKRDMLLNSDLIVCLPGGIGTISELLAYIEEKKSNDYDIPILLYNYNNFYGKILETLKELEQEKFMSNEVFDMFKIVNNEEEFKQEFNKIFSKGRVI